MIYTARECSNVYVCGDCRSERECVGLGVWWGGVRGMKIYCKLISPHSQTWMEISGRWREGLRRKLKGISTNHPAFCKQKWYPSLQNITKSLLFVTTWDRSGPYILERLAAFSSKNVPYQANFTQISSKNLSAGW